VSRYFTRVPIPSSHNHAEREVQQKWKIRLYQNRAQNQNLSPKETGDPGRKKRERERERETKLLVQHDVFFGIELLLRYSFQEILELGDARLHEGPSLLKLYHFALFVHRPGATQPIT
jgi:hypothetical protein